MPVTTGYKSIWIINRLHYSCLIYCWLVGRYGKKLIRFILVLAATSFLMIVALAIAVASSGSSTIKTVTASEKISQPKFPYEIVKQPGIREYSIKALVIFMPDQHFTETNIRQIFQWYAYENFQLNTLDIYIYTNRDLAEAANPLEHFGSCTPPYPSFWKRKFPWVYPPKWDASYQRYIQEWVEIRNNASESYEYKPFTILPFWKKKVILKQSAESFQ